METCPIKGTRPRGTTPAEDRELIKKLAANIKEQAEHVMIVDLERNDLGRVAMPGSVYVENFEEIKSFSKVHHMVSTVRGLAAPGTDSLLILKNIFPGGSITGAPKIRAMEIIEELESVPREIYTGGAGFIDFSGDMDMSILIRTAITKDGQLYLHVGGGIVTDSDPLAEYDETILKAMDFLSLLEMRPDALL
jgi:para-aminobenzoate synthetase component 1